MADLKIRMFESGRLDPETTVTIPGEVLEIAYKLIPTYATKALQENGIDLDEIIRLSRSQYVCGILVEIEDHLKNRKVAIALE